MLSSLFCFCRFYSKREIEESTTSTTLLYLQITAMPTALNLSGFMNSGQNAHALVQKVELIAELTLNKA